MERVGVAAVVSVIAAAIAHFNIDWWWGLIILGGLWIDQEDETERILRERRARMWELLCDNVANIRYGEKGGRE